MTTDTPRREAFENQYRKKPVVIEAMQWDGTESGWREINAGMNLPNDTLNLVTEGAMGVIELAIETLEGDMIASPDDWIIRGIKGELYPCKPDIFAATYEAALTPPATAGDARKAARLICRDIAELPDRTSPEDEPDMMLVTADELTDIILRHFPPSAEAKPGLTEREREEIERFRRMFKDDRRQRDAMHLDQRRRHGEKLDVSKGGK